MKPELVGIEFRNREIPGQGFLFAVDEEGNPKFWSDASKAKFEMCDQNPDLFERRPILRATIDEIQKR